MDGTTALNRLITSARRRIRLRYIFRSLELGLWTAAVLGLVLAIVSRLYWPVPVIPVWSVILVIGTIAIGAGIAVGLARPIMSERELALLLDRIMGTDELLVTALHLQEEGETDDAVWLEVERALAELPNRPEGMRTRPPKRIGLSLLPLLLAGVLLLVLPTAAPPVAAAGGGDQVEDEGKKLGERVDEIEEKFDTDLPEELERQVEELVQQLENGELTPEEAREEIESIREELEALENELEASQEALDDLEKAAEALEGAPGAEELADALEQGDMEKAAEAAEQLADSLEGMSEEQRQELAEALQQAGQELASSENGQLQQAGEQMQRAAEQLQGSSGSESGQESQSQGSESGESSQRQGSQGGSESGSQEMQELAEQLRQAQELAQQARQDAEQLAQAQELDGALEAANQGLGGEAGVGQGEGQGQGQGQGQAVGQGQGLGEGPAQAGDGHTWEDEGTSQTQGGHQNANRNTNRTGGQVLDDFEQLYAPVRLDGAESLVAGVEGVVDEKGHIDAFDTRLTGGREVAEEKLLTLPEGYREAKDAALNTERVPPGYRDAVKEYFDGMD